MLPLLLLLACKAESSVTDVERHPLPLLLVSVDGLMPEHLELVSTPHIDNLAKSGGRAESLIPIFPSKTFPVHYSAVTGLYAEQHGVIANSFNDPGLPGRFRYGSPSGAEASDWWGGEPIWVRAELAGLVAATMFWPGSDEAIRGVRPTEFRTYDGSMPNLERIDQLIEWLDPAGETAAVFSTLYMSDVDHAGHQYGPFADETLMAVAHADSMIGYLSEQLEETGLADSIHILLMSDHGMAETSSDRVLFLDGLIDLDRVEVIDWTPVALIRPEKEYRDQALDKLRQNEGGYRVYERSELPDRFHFRDHPRIPDIVMVAEPGYAITSRPYYYGRGLLKGMHGYDPEHESMHGIFIANGPRFTEGSTMGHARVIDLYELMCKLLEIDPGTNEGDPERFGPLLSR